MPLVYESSVSHLSAQRKNVLGGTWFKVITLSDEYIYDLALEILLNNTIKIQKMTVISLGN